MIYFIECDRTPYVKIGYAGDELACRRRLGEHQIGCPLTLRIITIIPGSIRGERRAHKALLRACVRGEWFQRQDAMAFMRLARRVGLESATEAMERWRDNEVRASAWRGNLLRKRCLKTISIVIRRLRADGWTLRDLAARLGCSIDTIKNATNEDTLLSFDSIARLAYHYPEEFQMVEQLWNCQPAKELTLAERAERIAKDAEILSRQVAA